MTHTSFICFSIGFCVAFYDESHKHSTAIVVIDSIVIACLTIFYALLLLKIISKKKAMMVLSYMVMVNVIVSGFLFMLKPNFEINISYAVNIIFILLFVMPFTTSRTQAIAFNIIIFLFFPILAFVSDNDFLWERLPSTLLFLNGIGITCIIFSKLITSFINASIKSNVKIKELSLFKQKITRLIIHDLKVPANAILNLSEDKQDRNMREINIHVRTINKQLEDILDIERLEEPNLVLDIHEFAVDQIVEQAIATISMLALKKNITIHTIFKSHGTLNCDFNLIKRTLINLLVNAIKYSPANGKIILSVDEQDKKCRIVLQDHGIGIPPEHLTKIFDKFYRVKNEKSANNTSTGLGLSFCKLAVQAHHGQIKAESDTQNFQGSKFVILLPQFSSTNTEILTKKNYTQDIPFTNEEKQCIANICRQVCAIPIYKVGELISLTKDINPHNNKNIDQWNEQFNEAVYTGNQDYLNDLIAPFLENQHNFKDKNTITLYGIEAE